MRAEQWRDGSLEVEEDRVLTIGFSFKHEMLLMLERVGFADIVVHGTHTHAEATSEDDFIVFTAREP